jgi:M6 family metalloprotease-like protein
MKKNNIISKNKTYNIKITNNKWITITMQIIKYILIFILIIFLNSCGNNERTINELKNMDTTLDYKEIPTIIIGINFKDYKLKETLEWSNKIFDNNFGTVNNYFLQATNDNLSLIPVDNGNNGFFEIYYDKNHPGKDKINEYVFESFIKALKTFNWKQYDKNKNKKIEKNELVIIFIIAGQEIAYGGGKEGVWAHSSIISTNIKKTFTINNYQFQLRYGLFGEQHKDHSATIGIICHEMSHAILELPDLYNTDNYENIVGQYSLMDSGEWNGINKLGDSPKEYSAYFKWEFNWINKEELNFYYNNNQEDIEIYNSNTEKESIIKINLTNDGSKYLLIENLSTKNYEQGIKMQLYNYNGGIIVWEIDEDLINENYNENEINTKISKGIKILKSNVINEDFTIFSKINNKYYEFSNIINEENKIIFDIIEVKKEI